jgi:hypothetical protein
MITVRLKVAFRFDHCEIPEGTVIAVPSGIAQMLILRGVAELASPEHAVVQPDETRIADNSRRKQYGRR